MLNYNSLTSQIPHTLSGKISSDNLLLTNVDKCIDEFLYGNEFSSAIDILSSLETINKLLCIQEKTFFLDYQHLNHLISQDFSELNIFNCSPFFIIQYCFSYYEKNDKFPTCHFNLIETSPLHLKIIVKAIEMLQKHSSFSFSYCEKSIYNMKKTNPLVYFSTPQDHHIFHNVKNIMDNFLTKNGCLLICASPKTSYHPLHDNFRQLILNKRLTTVFNDAYSSTYQVFNDEPLSYVDFYTESGSGNHLSVSLEHLMLNKFRLIELTSSQVQTLQDLSNLPYLTLEKEVFHSIKKDEHLDCLDKGDFECFLYTKDDRHLVETARVNTKEEFTLQNKFVFFRSNTLDCQYVFNDLVDEGFYFTPSEFSFNPLFLMDNFNSNISRYIFRTMFGPYAITDEYLIKEAPIFIVEYSNTKMIECELNNPNVHNSRYLFHSLYPFLHLPIDEEIFDCKFP